MLQLAVLSLLSATVPPTASAGTLCKETRTVELRLTAPAGQGPLKPGRALAAGASCITLGSELAATAKLAVPPGDGRITVSVPGYALVAVAAPAQAATLDVALTPVSPVHGCVVDRASKKPVAGATVVASLAGRIMPEHFGVPTGADGCFDLLDLPEQEPSVVVRAPGYVARIAVRTALARVNLTPSPDAPRDLYQRVGIGFEPEFTLVGARVLTVVPGSPAAKTLQVGDVILSSDGHPIRTPFDVSVYVGGAEGTKANLVVKRGNAELKLQLDRVMMNL